MEDDLQDGDPDTRLIHERFAQQARLYPDAVAISYEDQRLTYAELNERSRRLAYYLISQGAGLERSVAICMERGLETIVGLLGILKSGAAYMPLDPGFPIDRLRYMLEDCRSAVLLTQEHLLNRLPPVAIPVITLDACWNPYAHSEMVAPAKTVAAITPRNLAYIIYTSGSTGTPKGVMVEHGGVIEFLAALQEWFRFVPGLTWTLFHSLAFDFSVLEIWGALLSGAHLVIVPYATSRFPRDLNALIAREGVQVLGQTPSAFRRLVSVQANSLALKTIILGGEALLVKSLGPWYETEASYNAQITNLYGPTEATVAATYHPVQSTDADPHGGSVIGVALRNSTILILGEDRARIERGKIGEINIGGSGVARGYLNRPDLTAQRFIADPTDSKGGRLYRSGDLGRWRAEGALEYRGRNDSQVKVRGFRVELGDIESHLTAIEGVHEGVVVVQDGPSGEARFVAYLTLKDGVVLTPSSLKANLMRRLPVHMVPAEFVILPQLPLNTSGKIDRNSLLAVLAKSSNSPPTTA